jgi:hypothetical protein
MSSDTANAEEDSVEAQRTVRRFSQVVRVTMVDEPLAQGLAKKVDLDIEREQDRKILVEEAVRNLLGADTEDSQLCVSYCPHGISNR